MVDHDQVVKKRKMPSLKEILSHKTNFESVSMPIMTEKMMEEYQN